MSSHAVNTPVIDKSRLVRNSFFNSFSWAANVIANLVLVPMIVHYLGVEGFGIYALLTGLVGYFGILDLGLSQGVTKYVSHYAGLEEPSSVSRSINAALLVQSAVGGAGMFLIWIFAEPIVRILGVSAGYFEESTRALYVSSFGFFLTMILGTFSSALGGLQHYDLLGKTNIGFSIVTSAVIAGVLLGGGGLMTVIEMSVVMVGLNLVVLIILLRGVLPAYRITLRVSGKSLKEMFGFSSYMMVFQVSNLLNNYFVRFMVSVYWGPAAVTYYVVPMKLVNAVQSGIGSFVGVLFPFMSNLSARQRINEVKEIYLTSWRNVVLFSVPLFLFLILFSRQILTIWMGVEFAGHTWVILVLLGSAYFLATLTMVPANTVFGLGRSKVVAFFSALVALISVVFVSILTAKWAATGGAIAILITQIIAPVFVWYVTTSILEISMNEFFHKAFKLPPWFLGSYIVMNVVASLVFHDLWALSSAALVGIGLVLILGYISILISLGLVSMAPVKRLFE